jgi:hypothetical protein
MALPPTHYEVLGVPVDATPDEVRAAYRAAARDHHPDAGGDADRMRALNQAWGVLSDPHRRAVYDRELNGSAGRSGEDSGSSGFGPYAWPYDADLGLSADELAELADDQPVAPVRGVEGWWAITPPATFVASVVLFVGAVVFMAPPLLGLAAGVLVLSMGLFVLAPLRAMTRPKRR